MVPLTIIIVAYNRLDLVKKCLDGVKKFKPAGCEVVFVDNGSGEEVAEFVRQKYPQFKLIASKTNLGFGRGYNLGMKNAKGEYFLLLNTDAFLEEGVAQKLLNFAKSHSDLGVVAPQLRNADGSVQPSAGNFADLWRVGLMMAGIDNLPFLRQFIPSIHPRFLQAFSKLRTFGWVAGACVLVPKTVFVKTGGFDEKIFMYGEEVEWLYRINLAGWKVYYLPTAWVTHVGFASSSEGYGAQKEMESFLFFYKKHKPAWQLSVLRALLIFGCLLRALRGLVQPSKRWMLRTYLLALPALV